MQYIDMHCDTLAEGVAHKKQTITVMEHSMVDITRLKQAGAAAQFFAMFLPQKEYHEDFKTWLGVDEMFTEEDFLVKMYEIYQNTLKENADILAPARSYRNLMENQKNGKISAFLTIENGYPVKGKLENLKKYHDMGVSLITLTWNDPNCFGFPHSKNPDDMQKGLTDFGKEAVKYMNELGIIVDVSHLSDGGFYDVAKISKKPFVASHSNCRAVSPATRNLTDDMIKILAEKGGVAGINFEPSFLNKDVTDDHSRVEQMCEHILHFINVGGIECVGIGTDFDGIGGQLEINECTKMELLFGALQKRGIHESALEKIAFDNVARVMRESMQ